MTTTCSFKGGPVTDNLVDALAREAGAGYDVARLRRIGGRKPMGSPAARVVLVRLDPELDGALRARAGTEHATASEVIRHALHVYLDGPAAR